MSALRKMGLDSGTQFDVTDIVSVVELHGYDVPASTSPGDGGTTTGKQGEGSSFGTNDGAAVSTGSQVGVTPNA